MYVGSPVYRETNYQYALIVITFIVNKFSHFFSVGLKSLWFFRAGDVATSRTSKSNSRQIAHVDRVDTRSMGSQFRHVA